MPECAAQLPNPGAGLADGGGQSPSTAGAAAAEEERAPGAGTASSQGTRSMPDDFAYTIRPLVPGDRREQDAVYKMYLDNYDAYIDFACGVGDCKCADLGTGIKRYTERFATDMKDITASHLDTGGQFWVVEARPAAGGGPAEYAGCVGARRHTAQIAELHRVSVSPRHRRKALASRLVRTVEAWTRRQGFETMFLTTWTPKGCPGTAASSELYFKTGWDCVDRGLDSNLTKNRRGRAMIFAKSARPGGAAHRALAPAKLHLLSDQAFVPAVSPPDAAKL
eukprot:SAG22_NODE_3172_length_1880_cov_1.933184_1_plen_280_part_00